MKSNILLQGDIGTGKTSSLRTLLPEYIDLDGKVKRGAGLTPLLISLESGVDDTLAANICGAKTVPSPAIHVHSLPVMAVDWETVERYITLMQSTPHDSLVKLHDPARARYVQFRELFRICADFTCDRCGESFGRVNELDDTHAIALDGLSGLTRAATQHIVGGRPVVSLPEIGDVQAMIRAFLELFWDNTLCSAILLSHIDREVSPLTGMSSLTVDTIGQKLGPRLLKIPGEVITAQSVAGKFTWSTIETGTINKRRRLPLANDLAPDFTQLFRPAE